MNATTVKGAITIGPHTVPIVEIDLVAGQIRLTMMLPDPCPPIVADHYDLYDSGGQLIYRCKRHIGIPAHTGRWRLTVLLKIEGQTASPGDGMVIL